MEKILRTALFCIVVAKLKFQDRGEIVTTLLKNVSLNFEDPRNSIGLIIGRRFIASLSRVCSINKAAGWGKIGAARQIYIGKFRGNWRVGDEWNEREWNENINRSNYRLKFIFLFVFQPDTRDTFHCGNDIWTIFNDPLCCLLITYRRLVCQGAWHELGKRLLYILSV